MPEGLADTRVAPERVNVPEPETTEVEPQSSMALPLIRTSPVTFRVHFPAPEDNQTLVLVPDREKLPPTLTVILSSAAKL